MSWTKEPPIEPGWYWVKEHTRTGYVSPMHCVFVAWANGGLISVHDNSGRPLASWEWWHPATPPDPPVEDKADGYRCEPETRGSDRKWGCLHCKGQSGDWGLRETPGLCPARMAIALGLEW